MAASPSWRRAFVALGVTLATGSSGGCGQKTPAESARIGVLLSYSGDLAANSINSERALLMAVEAANGAGGVAGRPVALLFKDTRSDPRRVTASATALVDAGAALIIGPDSNELGVALKSLLADRTLILPSFRTADANIYKPPSWFVMGATAGQVACELHAQLEGDGRKNPVVISDANAYDALLTFRLTQRYGTQIITLPGDQSSNETTVQPITAAGADAYVLAAQPPEASSLFYALAALQALDPLRWYLAPPLHTPALLQNIPRGLLVGAHGVATGTAAGATEFRSRFIARWQDAPLDDAYPFYDAGAVAILALQRALTRTGTIPGGTGLSEHIVAVTRSGATPIGWDELGRGLQLLRQGQEVGYVGLSGVLEFDLTGQTFAASTNWWTVGPGGFVDVPSAGDCR